MGSSVIKNSLDSGKTCSGKNTREGSCAVLLWGWEDLLEKGMATHSSIFIWTIPWTEEPGGLPSMGPPAQRLMLSGCLIWSGSHLFPQLISQLASFLSSHLAVYQTSFNWLIMRHLSFYLTMVRISLISMLHQPICHLCIFSLTVTHHSCFISSIYQLSIHVPILVYHLCTYHVLSTNHLNFSISIIYFI